MPKRFSLNSFLIRATLIVLVALICVQLVHGQDIQDDFANAKKKPTTTVCQIAYINKTLNYYRLH